jgi:hypothetical protein
LITNNLFADYLNEFLLNPSLTEKVKYNFITGDLEMIDDPPQDDLQDMNNPVIKQNQMPNNTNIVRMKSAKPSSQLPQLTSTAEGVKKKLQVQLTGIIKNQQEQQQPPRPFSSACITNRSNETATSRNKMYETSYLNSTIATPRRQKSAFSRQVLNEINNHSFKDIDLIKITPWIEPKDLKDPKAAYEAKIPVIKNKYSVNIIKKPFSMKWLRNRRLTLFLQSEFYNEFKLAMIFAQFGLFNNDLNRNISIDRSNKKRISYVQVKLDDDLLDMKLNPL